METWEKYALGGAVVALVAAIVVKANASPPPSIQGLSKMPTGPYTPLSAGSVMRPGGTYLLSRVIPAGSNQTSVQAVQELQQAGFTLIGAWDVGYTPAGWPPGDPNSDTGIHVAVRNDSASTQPTGSDVTLWAVGATS